MNTVLANVEPGIGLTLGFGAFFALIMLFILLAIIGLFVFWIVMVIDALKRTNWPTEEFKYITIAVLVVSIFMQIWWLAALVYYFVIKKPLDAGRPLQFFTGTPPVTNPYAQEAEVSEKPKPKAKPTQSTQKKTSTKKV